MKSKSSCTHIEWMLAVPGICAVIAMKMFLKFKVVPRPSSVLALLLIALCQVSLGKDYDIEVPGQPPSIPIPKGVTLFQNVRIFDGTRSTLSAPSNVLIRGNTIERISTSPITVDANANVQVIAGNGRVLMPGLIDAH